MVLIASLFFIVCVLVGVVAAVLGGLTLWRAITRRSGEIATHMEPIAAGGDAAAAAAARLEVRRAQLEDASEELSARAAAAAALGRAAGTVAILIAFPLRFLMGR